MQRKRLVMLAPEKWMEDSLCGRRGTDPRDWDTKYLIPNPAHRRRAALKQCQGCPVITQCAGFAIRTGAVGMIYAGIALDEFNNMRNYAQLKAISERPPHARPR